MYEMEGPRLASPMCRLPIARRPTPERPYHLLSVNPRAFPVSPNLSVARSVQFSELLGHQVSPVPRACRLPGRLSSLNLSVTRSAQLPDFLVAQSVQFPVLRVTLGVAPEVVFG